MPDKVILLKDHEREVNYLHEEILRRDKLIEKLKAENDILIKTSLKRAEKQNLADLDLQQTI